MLSGEEVLCDGLSGLLRSADRCAKPLDLSIEYLDLASPNQLFLCRKALGYFFLQPVVAASVIVSVLRVCDDAIRETVSDLLFSPLLMNYGGALRDYLREIESSDPSYPAVQAALGRAEKYWAQVRSLGTIKEAPPLRGRTPSSAHTNPGPNA